MIVSLIFYNNENGIHESDYDTIFYAFLWYNEYLWHWINSICWKWVWYSMIVNVVCIIVNMMFMTVNMVFYDIEYGILWQWIWYSM